MSAIKNYFNFPVPKIGLSEFRISDKNYLFKNSKANLIFPGCILIVLLLIYFYFITLVTSNYFPVWSDEFFYYFNSISYVKNETLKAAFTFNGKGSLIFGADAHGVAYPLLHGFIAKIAGWTNLNLVITNFLFVFASLILYCFIKSISFINKLWISIYFLLFPFIAFYAFTFMQEAFHVFIAVLLSISIYFISQKKNEKWFIILFTLTVFTAGLFRGLWFFWTIGLLPFAGNKRQLVLYLFIFFTGICSSFLINHFFVEHVPNYFSSVFNLVQNGEIVNAFISLTNHFINNVGEYFLSTKNGFVYYVIRILIFAPFLFFVIRSFKSKSSLNTSLSLIGLINFTLLFVLYDVFAWREVRVLSPLLYFYIPFIVLSINKIAKYFLLLPMCLLFCFSIKTIKQRINERNMVNLNLIKDELPFYSKIAEVVSNDAIIYLNFIPSDYSVELFKLPLVNSRNNPIRYIIPYYNSRELQFNFILNKAEDFDEGKEQVILNNNFFVLQENKLN